MMKTQVLTPAGASAREEASTRLAGPLFRHRNAMGIGLALFLLLFPGGSVEPGAWQAALGLALAAAGVALRLWASSASSSGLDNRAESHYRASDVLDLAWRSEALPSNLPIFSISSSHLHIGG